MLCKCWVSVVDADPTLTRHWMSCLQEIAHNNILISALEPVWCINRGSCIFACYGVASGSGNILSSGVVIVCNLPNYIVSLFRGLRGFYADGGVTACGL